MQLRNSFLRFKEKYIYDDIDVVCNDSLEIAFVVVYFSQLGRIFIL